MKHILISAICICMVICTAGCAHKQDSIIISMEKQAQIDEVHAIMELMSTSVLSERYEAEDWEGLIEHIKQEELSSLDIFYLVSEVLTKYQCGHLKAMPLSQVNAEFSEQLFYPIYTLLFHDGYHLFATMDEYSDYLGMRLISLGGIDMQEVNERLARYIPCETMSAQNAVFECIGNDKLVISQSTYERCELLNEQKQLIAVFCDEQGKNYSVVFEGVPLNEVTDVKFVDADCTTHVRNRFSGKNYTYYGDSQSGVMYFDYFSCEEQDDASFEDVFDNMLSELLANEAYHTIVFDVRDNTGGNRMLARNMMIKYREELSRYHINVVTGHTTFSSGYFFVEDILEFCEDVIFYGEETGQAIDNYTEVDIATYSNLGIQLVYPTVIQEAPMIENRCKDHTKGFLPDVFVKQSYEDFMCGVDSVYRQMQ